MSLPVCHDDSIAPNATCHMCDLQACQVLYTVSTVNISDGIDGINMRLKIKLGWSYTRIVGLQFLVDLKRSLNSVIDDHCIPEREREVPNN